jgi:hypothetical protein
MQKKAKYSVKAIIEMAEINGFVGKQDLGQLTDFWIS